MKKRKRQMNGCANVSSPGAGPLAGFEEEIDQVFVAADNGDCRRAWDHFDRAEIEAAKADRDESRKLTMLQRQLLRACPSKTGRATEARMGIIEPGDFWPLAIVAVIAGAVLLSRRGTLSGAKTGYVKPGDPDDRFWHPWRYPPENVVQGKVIP